MFSRVGAPDVFRGIACQFGRYGRLHRQHAARQRDSRAVSPQMILFVSGATKTAKRFPVGELIVPGANSLPDTLKLEPGKWAMDNGAFSGFDAASFVRMLERFHGRHGCRFVAAPDVVADAH